MVPSIAMFLENSSLVKGSGAKVSVLGDVINFLNQMTSGMNTIVVKHYDYMLVSLFRL